MKKIILILILIFTVNALQSQDKKNRAEKSKIRIERYPDDIGLFISDGKCSFAVSIYFSTVYEIKQFSQSKCLSYSDTDPEGNVAASTGKSLEFYPNGRVAKSMIYAGIGSFHAMLPTLCDIETHYDKNGNKTFEKRYEQKCLGGRGIYRFFLPPGKYYVTESPLRVRTSPSIKGKTIGYLKKAEKVEVLDYTTERLEIKDSYAPWAKVKTAEGEGWVYGAYIEPVNYGETYKKFFQNIDWKKFAEKMGLE